MVRQVATTSAHREMRHRLGARRYRGISETTRLLCAVIFALVDDKEWLVISKKGGTAGIDSSFVNQFTLGRVLFLP